MVEPIKDKTLSRNQYRKVLMKYFLEQGLLEFDVCIRQPVTFVKAKFQDGVGNVYENFGWSKVCHPDQFSEKEGVVRALKRAAANAAKDFVNRQLIGKVVISDKYGKRLLSSTLCTSWKLSDKPLPYDITIHDL